MDSSKQQEQEVKNNSYDAYAEAAAESSWADDLEMGTSSIVTIFQRDHVEISEDDELADNLEVLNHSTACAVHCLYGKLSSASLPRVNRFCTKWLKQTNRSDVARQEPQEQPLTLSGEELSNQTLLPLNELDKSIGEQPEEQLIECLTSSNSSKADT